MFCFTSVTQLGPLRARFWSRTRDSTPYPVGPSVRPSVHPSVRMSRVIIEGEKNAY